MRRRLSSSHIEAGPACRGAPYLSGALLSFLLLSGGCTAMSEEELDDDALMSQLSGLFDDADRSPDACVGGRLASRVCRAEEVWKKFVAGGCGAFGMRVAHIGFGELCAVGGARVVEFQCCPNRPPPPPPACVSGVEGSNTTCLSEAQWKERLGLACKERGLELTQLGLDVPCGAVPGRFSYAKFECCGMKPPPPPMCIGMALGGDTSCKPEGVWKEYAAQACKEKGLSLTRISLAEPCDGGHRLVKFECCGEREPPPPPPPMCIVKEVGRDAGCKDEAGWKEYVTRACGDLIPASLAFGEKCEAGGIRLLKFQCCPRKDPPPPPMCTGHSGGGPDICRSEAAWKEYAVQVCAKEGLVVGALGFGERCDGGVRQIKFSCCPKEPPPPPRRCVVGALGADMPSCRTEASWKELAARLCAEKMMALASLGVDGACDRSGGYSHAKYSCCE